MKKLFLILFIGFCWLSPVFSQSETDNLDHQLWHQTQLNFPLFKKIDDSGESTDKLSLFLTGTLRAGRNMRHLVDERIGFGFDYNHNKNVSFTSSYLYIAQQPAAGKKQYESRLRFAVNLKKGWKKFSVDDRNLVEYRFRNSSADSVRYRNKFRFLYPIKKDKKEIFVPFVANEIFYDFQEKSFSRNEFSIGLTRKISSNVTSEFFYLLRNNKSGSPKHLNVFGINLKIKID